ncbi:MAG: hypothetical protein ACREOF_02345 [Gemmatimonadales bacterium]
MHRALLIAALVTACAGGSTDDPSHRTGPDQPAEAPDLRGTITARTGGSIRVEAVPGEESGSDKAVVRLTPNTRIETANGERLAPGALAVGLRVGVWFTGPVAESYPVQGDGRRVVVE